LALNSPVQVNIHLPVQWGLVDIHAQDFASGHIQQVSACKWHTTGFEFTWDSSQYPSSGPVGPGRYTCSGLCERTYPTGIRLQWHTTGFEFTWDSSQYPSSGPMGPGRYPCFRPNWAWVVHASELRFCVVIFLLALSEPFCASLILLCMHQSVSRIQHVRWLNPR
jgi:hypothetical protein